MVPEPHDAEVRLERRERVVRDLGLRRADRRDQRRLPRVGEARPAPRRPSAGSRARATASSPYSPCSAKLGARRAFERNRVLPRPPRPPRAASQVSPWLTRSATISWVLRSRTVVPSGTVDDEVLAPVTVTLVPRAVGPRLRLAVRMVPEREQRRDVAVGLEPDVAALAAVAAVGPALGHVGLTAHRDCAGTAVATLDVELRLVDETPVPAVTHDRPRLLRLGDVQAEVSGNTSTSLRPLR